MSPRTLYAAVLSGHSHRAALMLSLLDLPFERIDLDLRRGEQRQAPFLAINPLGQVPVLLDDGRHIADSHAILAYLAQRYDPARRWWPGEPLAAARVQRWMAAAAGPLLEGPGLARVEVLFGRPREPRRPGIAAKLFATMEAELREREFLAGDQPTVADVAMYAYTAHAPEGGISLQPYPALRAWLARIEALPRFIGMARQPAAPALADA